MSRGRRKAVVAWIGVWALVCVAGMALLWRYKAAPGDPGAPPAQWPAQSGLARAGEAPTLVMVMHPHCPCSRASLGELAEVMRRADDGVVAYAVLSVPDGVEGDPAAWARGELWTMAAEIPGVQVIVDADAQLAEVFGVETSGHVLVYDPAGGLRYSGGITGARGHAGDNVGRSRVVALLSAGTPDRDRSNVFGCEIEVAGE
jgi:hypothetical protein